MIHRQPRETPATGVPLDGRLCLPARRNPDGFVAQRVRTLPRPWLLTTVLPDGSPELHALADEEVSTWRPLYDELES